MPLGFSRRLLEMFPVSRLGFRVFRVPKLGFLA